MPRILKTEPAPYVGAFNPPPAEWFAMLERENGARVIGWRWEAETDPNTANRWRPAGIVVVMADALLYFDLEPDGSPRLCMRACVLHAPTRTEEEADVEPAPTRKRTTMADLATLKAHGLTVQRDGSTDLPWTLVDTAQASDPWKGVLSIAGRGCAATQWEAVAEGLARIARGDHDDPGTGASS